MKNDPISRAECQLKNPAAIRRNEAQAAGSVFAFFNEHFIAFSRRGTVDKELNELVL
jgi:hypothetical protein